MPMSRAEIQKRYREKKKKESGKFMRNERERKKKAYIPISMLSEAEAKKRRTNTLKRVKRHYEKKRKETQKLLNSDTVQTRQTSSNTLTIKMKFEKKGQRKVGASKAAMARAVKDVQDLKSQNYKLVREKRHIQKRLEQAQKKTMENKQPKNPGINNDETPAGNQVTVEEELATESGSLNEDLIDTVITGHKGLDVNSVRASTSENTFDIVEKTPQVADKNTVSTKIASQTKNNLTPRSKADKELRDSGLSPRKHVNLKRRLLEFHVLKEEVKLTKAIRQSGMKTARKYKCLRAFGKMLGMSRRSFGEKRKSRSSSRGKFLQEKVQAFLEREDNCVTMPGKKDQKDKQQKRILTDYLHNLYSKFRLENPETKISRSTSSKMRPKYILLVNFCNRNTCLCSRHQNIALKIKAIQEVTGTKNPDDFIAKNTDDEVQEKLQNIDKSNVTFTEWKRQEDNGKLRWKQVQTVVTVENFIKMFMQDVRDFREHVNRVKNQYSQMRRLRENLNDGHVLVWMDFAENFTCAALDEVQSAYWTSEQVTLHTTVVYFPKSHNKSHKSVVGISDLNIHNAGMVVSMVSNLIPIIKSEYPELQYVHYLTDSPTSQYRNKSIFEFLTRHKTLFGVNARWDFLESGHGKGPCDGLGGSVKRSADMAVKQGKVIIQNAKDFYAWAGGQSETDTSVSYFYVSQETYFNYADEMKERITNLKAITGTFKLHSVVPVGESKIASRDLSCNCESCLSDVLNTSCEGWKIHELNKLIKTSDSKRFEEKVQRNESKEVELSENNTEEHPDDARSTDNTDNTNNVEPTRVDIGEYCAAVYEDEWYIGIVTDINDSERKTKINFMEEIGTLEISLRWPSKRDEIWIPSDDIMMKIPEPYPSGSRRRLYKLGTEIIDLIETIHENKLK